MTTHKKASDPANNNSKATMIAESTLSYFIIGLLCIIAFGVYRYHFNFNPAVLSMEELRLETEIETSLQQQKADLPLSPPENFSVFSPPENFDQMTLSEKINGKAELYLPAGFKSLFAQRLSPKDMPDVWYEVFIYDMGSMLNAFSVYSAQRRDNAEPESFTDFAYSAENAIFWVHGPYYVEIIASEVSTHTHRHLLDLAGSFNSQNPVAEESIDEIGFFPQENIVKYSITFIPSNAFGIENLDRVFAARYRFDGTELTVFISRRDSADEAMAKAEEYINFFITYGGMEISQESSEIDIRSVEFFGTFDAVKTFGPHLVGVHEAASPEAAKKMVQLVYEKLRKE